MMNNVFFRTSLFENKESKPHFINPCCFGEDLLAWLLSRLHGAAFQFGGPIQEDYGWGFWVEKDFWVCVAILEESIGIDNPEWLITITYDPGLNLKKRLFGKKDSSLQDQIYHVINQVLQSEQRITDIRWCNGTETDCGEAPA
jgi:hypothetical protein